MVCWLIICALRRCGIASLVERCCILVLEVKLWRTAWALEMQCLFIAEWCGDWTVGMGSTMLTLVISGSKPGVLACVLHLWVHFVVCSFLGAVGLFANAVTRGVLTLWRMGGKDCGATSITLCCTLCSKGCSGWGSRMLAMYVLVTKPKKLHYR